MIALPGGFFQGVRKLRIASRNKGVSGWGIGFKRKLRELVSTTSRRSGVVISYHRSSIVLSGSIILENNFLSSAIFGGLIGLGHSRWERVLSAISMLRNTCHHELRTASERGGEQLRKRRKRRTISLVSRKTLRYSNRPGPWRH